MTRRVADLTALLPRLRAMVAHSGAGVCLSMEVWVRGDGTVDPSWSLFVTRHDPCNPEGTGRAALPSMPTAEQAIEVGEVQCGITPEPIAPAIVIPPAEDDQAAEAIYRELLDRSMELYVAANRFHEEAVARREARHG